MKYAELLKTKPTKKDEIRQVTGYGDKDGSYQWNQTAFTWLKISENTSESRTNIPTTPIKPAPKTEKKVVVSQEPSREFHYGNSSNDPAHQPVATHDANGVLKMQDEIGRAIEELNKEKEHPGHNPPPEQVGEIIHVPSDGTSVSGTLVVEEEVKNQDEIEKVITLSTQSSTSGATLSNKNERKPLQPPTTKTPQDKINEMRLKMGK